MVVAGGLWPVIVALTPASDRPWISGTADNSIWSLILGYNGLGRLTGQAAGPGGNAVGGGVFGGETGWLRLLDPSMGGQAGWFLGFALVAGGALLAATRLRRADARSGWLIAVGGAFLTTAVAFSFAQGIFHPYYVSLLAPFTAALVGAGRAARRGRDGRPHRGAARGRRRRARGAQDPRRRRRLARVAARSTARARSRGRGGAGVPAPAGRGARRRDRRAADRARRLVGADARPRH
jgi:4-amino-4-deoxy-L-arabinose transferase-like glycosyltransferase